MNTKGFVRLSLLILVLVSLFTPFRGAGAAILEEGTDDAAFLWQYVPTTMVAGQSYTVTVTMRNTGTTTWTNRNGYKLASQNPADNMTWGLNRVEIPRGRAVTPGTSVTLRFTAVAPATTGVYNFQWQMVRDTHDVGSIFFGAMSPNVPVNVIGGTGGADDAAFVSQSVASPMVVGQTYAVSVRMRNTGTTTWTPDAGYVLGAQNPPGNTTWGVSQVPAPSPVTPGAEIIFNFNITAPATPGVYNFQWQMLRNGVGYFGQITPNVAVNVGSGTGTNDASYLSQTVPTTVLAGASFGVTITMHNAGDTTWTNETGYRLGSQNPQDNATWGTNRITLPGPVAPGQNVTFGFNVTAPATAGTYNFQWQMVQDGVAYFGQMTPNVAIVVSTGGTGDEGYGNNLSVPAIFAEGHGITGLPTSVATGLRPTAEEPVPSLPYFDPNYTFLLNGVTYYPQQTPSVWQADWANGNLETGEAVVVNWSDNLLNTKWTPKSVIRVENTLYVNPADTMTAYTMQKLSGQGTDESWGTDTVTYESTYRTVYTNTARLKIEKISAPGGTVIAHPASFNGAVYEKYGTDGPGGYGAEVNVSGNLIYGYNWQLNNAEGSVQSKLGWWRLTFTLDTYARYWVDGTYYNVPCNVSFASLDPVDLTGTFFVPQLVSSNTTILEIEIVNKKSGSGRPADPGGEQ